MKKGSEVLVICRDISGSGSQLFLFEYLFVCVCVRMYVHSHKSGTHMCAHAWKPKLNLQVSFFRSFVFLRQGLPQRLGAHRLGYDG